MELSRLVVLGISGLVLLSGCATQSPTSPGGELVPGTSIQSTGLLKETYATLQQYVSKKYSCSSIRVVKATRAPSRIQGAVVEDWTTDTCGKQRIFVMFVIPDGGGGYSIRVGEFKD